MLSKKSKLSKLLFAAMLSTAVLMAGCDSDDVTGPMEVQNAPPVTSTTNNSTWSITVSANPTSIDINFGGSSDILVSARRSDNNQPIAAGTTALLTTTGGLLTNSQATTGDSIPITFDAAGQARAVFNIGVLTNETTIIVRAQVESSFGSAQIQMVDAQAPPLFLTNVAPNFGPPSGGTSITINGSGFISPARVTFQGSFGVIPLTNVRVRSSSRITAVTPEIDLATGSTASAIVTVESGLGTTSEGSSSLANGFLYTRSSSPVTMKVFGISPTQGPNEGGTRVSIRGEGFGSEAQVFFGGAAEATVLSISSTELEVLTPAATGTTNVNSTVQVSVSDPNTGFSVTANTPFSYGPVGGLFISAVSPNQVEYLGGDLITIFGQGFSEPVAVTAAEIGQQVISVSGTEVIFRSSRADIVCADISGEVRVKNIETNEDVTGTAQFTYSPIQPQIFGVSGPFGNTGVAGSTVVINGAPRSFGIGFDPPVQVDFGGNQASNPSISVDGTTITVSAPNFSGTYPTEICCTLPDGTQIEGNATAFVDVTVTNLNTTCSDSFSGAFGYNPPADTTCAAATECSGAGGGGGGGGTP